MHQIARVFAMVVILAGTSVAWLVLAGIMDHRSSDQEQTLSGAVAELWGAPMVQRAPAVLFEHPVTLRERVDIGTTSERWVETTQLGQDPVPLGSTDATVDLRLDQRRKGLIWFSLYDVTFDGAYTYTHEGAPGTLVVRFEFPQADGFYDDFHLVIDGVERWDVAPVGGTVEGRVPVQPGQTVAFSIGYRSRGRDSFVYRPVPDWSVGQVRDLHLAMTTDFATIDFPPQTMSPSEKADAGQGKALTWSFDRLITGQSIGMVMPQRIQAGPLAAAMSLSAPLSLALYMVWIYVLGLLKRIEIHPVNHLFLAAAFFTFHLLFGYTADHLPVEAAFALSAVVSLVLTTTYLRLVAGARFAVFEAGIAQLLYLVGFSLAQFFEGWTGLTVTVLGTITLFLLMQLTGRIRWAEVFGGPKAVESYR
ncbi:MAG: inner membrane CreD family protein [Myxococcota bacterium]